MKIQLADCGLGNQRGSYRLKCLYKKVIRIKKSFDHPSKKDRQKINMKPKERRRKRITSRTEFKEIGTNMQKSQMLTL